MKTQNETRRLISHKLAPFWLLARAVCGRAYPTGLDYDGKEEYTEKWKKVNCKKCLALRKDANRKGEVRP